VKKRIEQLENLFNSSTRTLVAEAVRTHHERWNGGGYPDGLKATEIPPVARILAVADAFDAMTSSRAYRRRLLPEEAIKRINDHAGSQFDPALVRAFTSAFKKGLLDEIHALAVTLPPKTDNRLS
jgi:HD-GYP domain-containing protein (c-di-GMP phosphodiesterase class II)